jgi:cyclic-di-AMP phosphodiesterase PgpH
MNDKAKDDSSNKKSSRGYIVEAGIFALTGAFTSELLFGYSNIASNVEMRVFIIFGVLSLVYLYVLRFQEKYVSKRDFITLTGLLVFTLVVVWTTMVVAFSVAHTTKSPLLHTTPLWGIPFAAGPMLVQLVLGSRYSLVLSLSIQLLLHVYSPENQELGLFALATSLVGCSALLRVRTRSAYFRAGSMVSIVAMLFPLFRYFLNPNLDINIFFFEITCACIGGITCFLIVAGFAPILESVGGYATDLRLIEMATLDHPLLRELSIQAPGTWNHSMVMGMMSEVAAEAVGANPVVARVACYYHDIGKAKKPLYFVENQVTGENPHFKLSPSMSALIIKSHVRDGLEMAKQYHLPDVIHDMISQHHGTSVIEYFYEKAVKENEASGGEADAVEIHLYRYPGPKPQTRVAGILMLADGIEAASRTISEHTADRIQGMVQKMINKVFSSGQLDECDLTLQDLHRIARCFTRVLSGIYHQRIAYAEPAEKLSKNANKTVEKIALETKSADFKPSSDKKVYDADQANSFNINSENEVSSNSSTKDSDTLKSDTPQTTGEGKSDKASAKDNLKRLGL